MKKRAQRLLVIIIAFTMLCSINITGFLDQRAKAAEPSSLTMTGFIANSISGNDFKKYTDTFGIPVSSIQSNKTAGWGSNLNSLLDIYTVDDKASTHFETNGRPTWVDLILAENTEVGRIVFGGRNQGDPNKGFPTKYNIYVSDSTSPDKTSFNDADGWRLVGNGSGTMNTALQEILLPAGTRAKSIRFEWVECCDGAGGRDFPCARVLLPFKSDTLNQEILALFTDSSCQALRPGVTVGMINDLQSRVNSYLFPEQLQPYIDIASMLKIGISSNENFHEPMVLSQRGNRNTERARTDTGMTLASFDLSGYYVHPGESISVFCNADASSVMPRIVFATVARTPWGWYNPEGGDMYDGVALKNGLNVFTIPADRPDCYTVYFYNPALPQQQAFAPTVRLSGGTKYPVYRYDAGDSYETTKAKEQEFLSFLDTYLSGVSDSILDQLSGKKYPNIAEFVSDKIIISVSARGVKTASTQTVAWNKGQWQEFKDTVRYGVKTDEGIYYTGPAATMEAYEMLFDDIQLYSGFNITDPSHPDYRNHGQFLFRAYNDGAGLGWGQSVYSGYNTENRPDGDPLNNSFYVSLCTPGPVLEAGWAEYHEIGHVFDNASIGTSESTNNLYGLNAGTKFKGENRLDQAGENRWYNHFTSYINTGILPQNDLLFYPGAVIWQLNAVDFSDTRLYKDDANGDNLLSNYGMACRYARQHKAELNGLDKDSKTVVAFSMACGVDLSTHFEYFGRTISDRARIMISGLPKETRPTWYVTDRAFTRQSFNDSEKATEWTVEANVNESNGYVTITCPVPGEKFSENDFLCYEAYKVALDGEGNEVGDREFVGITGLDKKGNSAHPEMYTIIDKKIVSGTSYKYFVKAYDRKLESATHVATAISSIPQGVVVPLERILINTGDEGKSMNVGNIYKLRLNYYPQTATVDLNSINWWLEGWGRDNNHTGAAEDIVLLTDDPDYPKDPTRKMLTGVQPGQTHVKVSINGMKQEHRIVISGNLDVADNLYTFSFPDGDINTEVGNVLEPKLTRTTKSDGTVVNVRTYPNTVGWRSSNEKVAKVSNGKITACGVGKAVVEFYRISSNTALASVNVNVLGSAVPATSIRINNAPTDPIKVKDTINLSASIEPSNNTENGKIKWQSLDPDIIRVDQNGIITAISGGKTTIVAWLDSMPSIEDSVEIEVSAYNALQRLDLDKKNLYLDSTNLTATLRAIKVPDDASAKGVVWSSSNENVATVSAASEDGMATVTGKGTGKCLIYANLEGKTVSCTVSVDIAVPLTGATFINRGSDTTVTSADLKVGNTLQLSIMPTPDNVTALNPVVWESDNLSVATVSQGLIKAVSAGSADITGKFVQPATGIEKSVTCHVTVRENIIPLTGISLNRGSISLNPGDEQALVVNLRPVNANNMIMNKASWESDNPAVASVNENGLVKAISQGSANITAKLDGFSATCQIVVSAPISAAEQVSLSKSELRLEIPGNTGERVIATVLPAGAENAVYWSIVSGGSVVSIKQDGTIIPKAAGKAVVRATAAGGRYSEVNVTVVLHSHISDKSYSADDNYHWKRCLDKACVAPNSELEDFGYHVFQDKPVAQALASPATATSAALYYKSCICGKLSNQTFSYGSPLSAAPVYTPSYTPDNQENAENPVITQNPENVINTDNSVVIPTITTQESNPVTSATHEVSIITRESISSRLLAEDNRTSTYMIATKAGVVTFDQKAMEHLMEKSLGDNISFVFEKHPNKENVYTLYLESNGERIYDFNGGKVTVGLFGFDIPNGKDPKYYHVYYLPENGKAKKHDTWYSKGYLHFTTTHFSDYEIVYDESMENITVRPVYRFYNPNTGDHILTISKAEKKALEKAGWDFEGVAFNVGNDGDMVFRLYNEATGRHFYTTDFIEKNNLISKGWLDEGTAFMAQGNRDVYLMSNRIEHLLTTNKNEIDALTNLGWTVRGLWFKVN